MSEPIKKETWKMIINMLISILTAIATTLGLTSCM
ncbi:MAG: smalltalk protein [Prevotella sp.]|nr:smalltalk protein [Prevotella sp.]MCI2080907.1 smalltalk protein [Prevotella sp.]MCI2102819.1 smalltalk protein [Prevotella sp.]